MTLRLVGANRLPDAVITNQLFADISRANEELASLQQQVATNQQFELPSESPAEAIRTIFLQGTIERRAHLETNITTSSSMLRATESALGSVGETLTQARSKLLAGLGDTASDSERIALADEVASLIQTATNAANTTFRGRYLFAGSTTGAPFEAVNDGTIRYDGDTGLIESFVDVGHTAASNVHGHEAFLALNTPAASDVDPALTLESRLDNLLGGAGVTPGTIEIVADDGTNPPQTETIDLSGARTIQDVKTLIEDAFSGSPPTVTVDVDPGTLHGIRIQQSGGGSGTLTVDDVSGGTTARELGILGTGSTINGQDLNPRLTLQTNLSDLNGGTGIGTTAGNGITVTVGDTTRTIDLSSATTVEDFFNLLHASGLELHTGFNDAGNAFAISSRKSGTSISIGENNGSNATLLGIRTLTGSTALADLNHGVGVPNQAKDEAGNLLPAEIEITRRDGTTSTVDLKGLTTVQQVVDAITAVDANLTASLNTVGNGISIVDASGTGPLEVASNELTRKLGIDGSETGTDNTVPLVGRDVNPHESAGTFDLLLKLEDALRTHDFAELSRLDPLFDAEINRFNGVRGRVGSRLRLLERTQTRLGDEDVHLQEKLSELFDTDLADAVSRVSNLQSTLEASLSIAASTMQLNLFAFL